MKYAVVSTVVIGLVASTAGAQRAADFVANGNAKSAAGDIAGAIDDYSKAIDLSPTDVNALYQRGLARQLRCDFDGAIADHTRVIELLPNLADAYVSRSIDKRCKGDLEGAIVDASRALELQPDLVAALVHRSIAKRFNGEYEGALADASKAIAMDPGDSRAHGARAGVYYDQLMWAEALPDLRKEEIFNPTYDYARFRVWVMLARQGQKNAAAREMVNYMKVRVANSGDWAAAIGGFLAGRITEADLLKAAANDDKIKDSQQHCEAYYYAAVSRLADGNSAGAKDYFTRCVATGVTQFFEYRTAKAELKQMEGAK